jgi:DNA helicase-2/ATP-dependent DNA helicase PcrA
LPDKNVVPKLKTKWVKDEKFLISSYSSLEYYLTCPFRYKLLIMYNLATPPNPFFQFGKVIHAALGYINLNLAKEKQISLTDAELYYDTLFDNYFRNPNIPNYVVVKQKLRGKKVLKNYYRKKNSWFDKVKLVENDFEYVTANALVKGRYDLVIGDPKNGVTIVDFKTGTPHDYLRTDFQMQVYSLAGLEQLKLPVKKAILYYIEEDQEFPFSINDSFLCDGKKNLEYIIEGIVSEKFDPTPGGMCTRCEVNNFCEEFERKEKKHDRRK